ncbi:Uncharacterized protein QTN25_002185 [Entamoeba marina]
MFGHSSNVIRVSVIHSHIGGKPFWKHLGRHWQQFGSVPIKISTKMMKKKISLKRLMKEKPNVIICSDTAGSPSSFTDEEINALNTYLYLNLCRHIIGTYALFQHLEHRTNEYDNRRIAPLFGLNRETVFTTKNLERNAVFYPTYPDSMLWKNVEIPFESTGYQHSQVPISMSWVDKANKLICSSTAQLLAKNNDGDAVILYYASKTHSSIYISTMPEFNDLQNTNDLQLFYNCIKYLSDTDPLLSLQSLCLKKLCKSHCKYKTTLPPQLCDVLTQINKTNHHSREAKKLQIKKL